MPASAVRHLILGTQLLATVLAPAAWGQGAVTSPVAFFGHPVGADYLLPDYERTIAFWRKLDDESERMRLVDIGRTAEGRTQWMAIVTSPANHASLARYKEISRRLALADVPGEEAARALAREGKAVVWIDGGLHADEVLGAQQLTETIYQLVSRDDEETRRILDDVIVLAVHANPDGHELVADWYMRRPEPLDRSSGALPRLYQKYIGHDNNRDFYMSTQPETENLNRQLYHEWFPQIMYNHHQTGPVGTVMFAPPFRDPFNYLLDPQVVAGLDLVGGAMQKRFLAEGKPGVTVRGGSTYSTWWNGGLRTTVYFHNMIGLLTETIGHPTPFDLPFVASRQLPSGDLLAPIAPQRWHFRSSVDYSVTANYAVLDIASRYKDAFLLDIYRMGRASIDRGSRDHWTAYPDRVAEVEDSMRAAGTPNAPGAAASRRFHDLLHRPEWRDPRGYVLPSDQPDFPRVVHLVNALRETGITVHRATAEFVAGGKVYPAGSYVIRSAQPFRAHLLDMFEPQDHPNDFLYPGGPPIPPYDVAGWTLAYQMGVSFDRILDPLEGPFQEVRDWNVKPDAGAVGGGAAAGWLLSARYNDAFPAALRLAAAGEVVRRVPAGRWYVAARSGTRARLERLAAESGMSFTPTPSAPAGAGDRLRVPRIALWDRYGGSIESGWTRWILEQRGIPFDVVYPAGLDAGRLRQRYDVIVFPSGAIPAPGAPTSSGPVPESIPPEYRARLGSVTASRTIPQLKAFLEAGGTVVTIGRSTALAAHLSLPIGNHLVDSAGVTLRREAFYIPGSILRARLDLSHPVTAGMDQEADFFFDESPVFTVGSEAEAAGIRRVAWFDDARPLRSGWAWGEDKLQGGAAVVAAPVGRGMLYLFGPEIPFRAQSHGTFKLLFNALALSTAR